MKDILWGQIELLVSEKKAKSYEKAIELLIDLRDLALWEKSTEFALRLDALKKRHSTKSSFVARYRSLFLYLSLNGLTQTPKYSPKKRRKTLMKQFFLRGVLKDDLDLCVL